MVEDSDWRLQGQERYLQSAVLLHRKWHTKNPKWDHDHCEFCWAKFMDKESPDVLREGYCTENSYHWICDKCFNDFKEKFGFVVKD